MTSSITRTDGDPRVQRYAGMWPVALLVAMFLFAAEQAQGPQVANAQDRPENAVTKTEQHKSFWQRTTDDPRRPVHSGSVRFHMTACSCYRRFDMGWGATSEADKGVASEN